MICCSFLFKLHFSPTIPPLYLSSFLCHGEMEITKKNFCLLSAPITIDEPLRLVPPFCQVRDTNLIPSPSIYYIRCMCECTHTDTHKAPMVKQENPLSPSQLLFHSSVPQNGYLYSSCFSSQSLKYIPIKHSSHTTPPKQLSWRSPNSLSAESRLMVIVSQTSCRLWHGLFLPHFKHTFSLASQDSTPPGFYPFPGHFSSVPTTPWVHGFFRTQGLASSIYIYPPSDFIQLHVLKDHLQKVKLNCSLYN